MEINEEFNTIVNCFCVLIGLSFVAIVVVLYILGSISYKLEK